MCSGHIRDVVVVCAVAAAMLTLAGGVRADGREFGGGERSRRSCTAADIGCEVSVPQHYADGDEFKHTRAELLEQGRRLFIANWTIQEGGGRPLTKGTGAPLSDKTRPLVFPLNFNRISAPDSNSCAGCHNAPFGIPGGGGDIVGNVSVLGQRFDFATFDPQDLMPTRGSLDERGRLTSAMDIANSRATLGMFGSGFIEMLARQMTADLQRLRDSLAPGEVVALRSKGVSFGTLRRLPNGIWDLTDVEGLPAVSLVTKGSDTPPDLVVRPFHQAGRIASLREFTNNALNHHHGIQASERFGDNTDPDGDGFYDELSRADVTALTLYQAALPVPGRVIPRDRRIEAAIWNGEHLFDEIGCASCHRQALPLTQHGWIFTEPGPYNPPGNLSPKDGRTIAIDLTQSDGNAPTLPAVHGVVEVPAYTDLKLHDICSGKNDPNAEPLDMQQPANSAAFFAGNRKFVTKRLWGAANEPPYFHHGKFTTLREAIHAHAGEAAEEADAFASLSEYDANCIIEFLKSLQVLPPGSKALVVDEHGNPRPWIKPL